MIFRDVNLPRVFGRLRQAAEPPFSVIDGKRILSFADFGVLGFQRAPSYQEALAHGFERFGAIDRNFNSPRR